MTSKVARKSLRGSRGRGSKEIVSRPRRREQRKKDLHRKFDSMKRKSVDDALHF